MAYKKPAVIMQILPALNSGGVERGVVASSLAKKANFLTIGLLVFAAISAGATVAQAIFASRSTAQPTVQEDTVHPASEDIIEVKKGTMDAI